NLCYAAIMARAGGAVQDCRRTLALAPESRATNNNLALAHAARGELDEARRLFSSSPDAAAASYNIGVVYMSQRQFRKAAEAVSEAVNHNPRFGLAADRARQARAAAASQEVEAEQDEANRR